MTFREISRSLEPYWCRHLLVCRNWCCVSYGFGVLATGLLHFVRNDDKPPSCGQSPQPVEQNVFLLFEFEKEGVKKSTPLNIPSGYENLGKISRPPVRGEVFALGGSSGRANLLLARESYCSRPRA